MVGGRDSKRNALVTELTASDNDEHTGLKS